MVGAALQLLKATIKVAFMGEAHMLLYAEDIQSRKHVIGKAEEEMPWMWPFPRSSQA